MVNYKRVVCEVAALFVVLTTTAAAPTPDCTHTHYDQSQNGTENIRVNIDGVVIAVAPAEALVDAASEIADYFDQASLDFLLKPGVESLVKPEDSSKPEINLKPDSGSKPEISLKPDSSSNPENSLNPKPEKPLSDVSPDLELTPQKKDTANRKPEKGQRVKNRLVSMLLPLLRRTRHH